jgi:hypothetical protein
MRDKQREIKIEQTMYSILGVMMRHQNDNVDFNNELLCKISPTDNDIIIDAVTRGLKNGYLAVDKKNYVITQEGIGLYEESMCRNEIVSDYASFRNEVLTGTTISGKQSRIDRAVLPTGGYYNKKENTQETRSIRGIETTLEIDKFMDNNGEDEDSMREGLESGRIGICYNGYPHIGEFHKAGDGYRAICKRCRSNKQ